MKNTRKGFTIVELVIVIAVVAILAAVLIPTFVSLVNKANVANDTALVKNLNTALAADSDGCKTMSEALAAAADFGYDVAKINAKGTNNEILWDSVNNVFCYFDSEKDDITYIPDYEAETETADIDFWVIASTPSTKYSTYLYGASGEINAAVGIDVGECENITRINYSTNATQSVIIKTNSSATELVISAENSDVKHYGAVGNLAITAVAPNSYHENGQVNGTATIASGRIVVENDGVIPAVKIMGENVKIETNKDIAVSVADTVTNVDAIEIKATVSSVKVAVDASLSNKVEGGEKVEIVEVANAEELKAALSDGKTYILLTANITTDAIFEINHSCVIDGDGYKIENAGALRGTSTSTYTNIVIGMKAADKIDVELRNLSVINTRTNAAGRPIETRGNINSLTLLNVTLDTSVATTGYRQALTIGGNQADKANIVIKNSDFKTGHGQGYALIMFNPVDLTIDETTIEGWSTLYFKGVDGSAGTGGSVANITNSKLISTNINSGDSNNFACVVLEANNIEITIDSTEMLANEEGAANQRLFDFSYENYNTSSTDNVATQNNTIRVKGDTTITYGELVADRAGEGTTNKLVLENGMYILPDMDISEYVADGYTAVKTAAGYLVTKN